jgi:hypothetical protein
LAFGLLRAAWGGFVRVAKLITEDSKSDGLPTREACLP